ncbi:MAG: hypothetical protein H0W73_20475 [Bacteroidetes bacterium]|nr:hypothetical protein [Bacteroidota bacterium]
MYLIKDLYKDPYINFSPIEVKGNENCFEIDGAFGSKESLLLRTTGTVPFLCSPEFKLAVEQNGLTGIQFIEATIFKNNLRQDMQYFLPKILGRISGPNDWTKCGVVTVGTDEKYKGLYVDVKSWTGHDFFLMDENSFVNDVNVYISSKAERVISKLKIKNFHTVPFSDILYTKSIIDRMLDDPW